MIEYKPSKYNFFFPFPQNPKQMVAYNTRSGCIALIEKEKYEQFHRFEKTFEPIKDEELLNDLRYGGYIVDTDVDELKQLRYELLRVRYSPAVMSLAIAPTSDCNFRCIYCYEKNCIKPLTMSDETQEDLINFLNERIPYVRNLQVTWYGGEPLLEADIIERLSKRIIAMCEPYEIEYSAAIITNGYLLTPEVVKKLCELRVNNIQITLDGAAEDHDKRRFLANRQPTFDQIIENLYSIKDIIPYKIAIRINADRHNIGRVDQVVRVLRAKGLMDITVPYLAMVENSHDTYSDHSCFHANEFSKIEFEFVTRNGLDMLRYIPNQTFNYCDADADNAFVVAPDGLLYKCWTEIGKEQCSVGSVKDGVKENPHFLSYMLYDATQDPMCKECNYLPICMGGCPLTRLHKGTRCPAMKDNLATFMNVIPTILEAQANK